MAWEKKVIWSEGMMLQPHHFQQQSRYHESQLRYSSSLCRPHFWGICSIEIDKSHLKNGKFSLTMIILFSFFSSHSCALK